ncbi:VacJ family lipoprotein [Pararhodobacter sp.]|uniref:MlaA family lipoprotein n=1 Tax=Pararhodobacter sp. TaxID=2127056 RepID=UPI002AFF8EED|nr:VacJ family lipoprotein [Pararhodobacter sp.]
MTTDVVADAADPDALADIVEGVAPTPPSPFRRIVSNFGSNLGIPSTIVNDLLQIRPDRAAENTLRLVVNTTIGVGGLFDPAGAMGLHGRTSDFGETLHRWGVGEGAYMVLPVLGPTTERDATGMIVDIALNPLRYIVPSPEIHWTTVARAAGRMADRAEYADLLDANVINTSDPYAQARLLYLQTRRYHLGIENEAEVIDPYADF